MFVGWGSQRWFTEFDADGNVVFDGRLARGNDNYRAFRFPWAGTPGDAAEGHRRESRRQGHRPGELERRDRGRPLGAARRRQTPTRSRRSAAPPYGGFETAVGRSSSAAAVVALRAYDAAGNVLVTTTPVKPGS